MKYSISDFKKLPAMQMEKIDSVPLAVLGQGEWHRIDGKNSLRTQILKELILLANTNASKKKKK